MADPFPKTNLGPGQGPWPIWARAQRALGPKIAAPGRSQGPRDFWAQGPGPIWARAGPWAQIGLGEWVGQGQAIKYIIYYILYIILYTIYYMDYLSRSFYIKSLVYMDYLSRNFYKISPVYMD